MVPRPPLSVSLAGLSARADAPWAGSARAPIEWAASGGFRAVRLDAAALRARDLDRSARRDLAALLKRLSLGCQGLDLWIPPGHFTDAANADRAVQAAISAAELAADLRALLGASGVVTLALTLPEKGAESAIATLAERAATFGVTLADHAFPLSEPSGMLARQPGSAVGIGIDPAAVLMGGGDPAAESSRAGRLLAAARLSDASALGRVAPGEGRLDELAYLVALSTAGYRGDIALDLRSLPEQERVAGDALRRWNTPVA
jgi:sugar phosphate isomerase/epimerase